MICHEPYRNVVSSFFSFANYSALCREPAYRSRIIVYVTSFVRGYLLKSIMFLSSFFCDKFILSGFAGFRNRYVFFSFVKKKRDSLCWTVSCVYFNKSVMAKRASVKASPALFAHRVFMVCSPLMVNLGFLLFIFNYSLRRLILKSGYIPTDFFASLSASSLPSTPECPFTCVKDKFR